MPVLYKMNASPASRTVMVTADILNLELETREVSLPDNEHLKPDFQEKNPLHQIPLLEDEDFLLADSHAIIIYLISKYGSNNAHELYPTDVKKRAIIHQRLFFEAYILYPRFMAIIKEIVYDHEPHMDEKTKADVDEAYGFLDKYLQANSFLAGEQLTIADISCVTTASSLSVLVPIDAKYVKLIQWLNNLKNQEWYLSKNQPGVNDLDGYMKFYVQRNEKEKNNI